MFHNKSDFKSITFKHFGDVHENFTLHRPNLPKSGTSHLLKTLYNIITDQRVFHTIFSNSMTFPEMV